MKTNSFFTMCNIVRMSELKIIKSNIPIKLPFYFHIKDIPNTFFDEENVNIQEYYGSDLNIQNDNMLLVEKHLHILNFIDLKQFTIEDDDEVPKAYKDNMVKTKNGYIFKDHNSLYAFLIRELHFNEVDFVLMENFIINEQSKIIKSFHKILEEQLDIGKNKDTISEPYMILRGAFELNHAGTLFPENKGLSFSEYSLREFLTYRYYLSRKCEIEKAQYDEVMKKNKK